MKWGQNQKWIFFSKYFKNNLLKSVSFKEDYMEQVDTDSTPNIINKL